MSTQAQPSTETTPAPQTAEARLEARLTAGPYVERYRGVRITVTLKTWRRNRAGQPPPCMTVTIDGSLNQDSYPLSRASRPGEVERILGWARANVDNALVFTPDENRPRTIEILTGGELSTQTLHQPEAVPVGAAELQTLNDAKNLEEAARENYRNAWAGGGPTRDPRPLVERRADPNGNPNRHHPAGPAWDAAHEVALVRLQSAEQQTAKARAAFQSAMRATWDAADEALYAQVERDMQARRARN